MVAGHYATALVAYERERNRTALAAALREHLPRPADDHAGPARRRDHGAARGRQAEPRRDARRHDVQPRRRARPVLECRDRRLRVVVDAAARDRGVGRGAVLLHEVADFVSGFPHFLLGPGTREVGLACTSAPPLALAIELAVGLTCVVVLQPDRSAARATDRALRAGDRRRRGDVAAREVTRRRRSAREAVRVLRQVTREEQLGPVGADSRPITSSRAAAVIALAIKYAGRPSIGAIIVTPPLPKLRPGLSTSQRVTMSRRRTLPVASTRPSGQREHLASREEAQGNTPPLPKPGRRGCLAAVRRTRRGRCRDVARRGRRPWRQSPPSGRDPTETGRRSPSRPKVSCRATRRS